LSAATSRRSSLARTTGMPSLSKSSSRHDDRISSMRHDSLKPHARDFSMYTSGEKLPSSLSACTPAHKQASETPATSQD
jgi:hypothetical protein